MKLLETLMNAYGVSGHEEYVRDIIKKEIRPYVDDITIDKMGNLIAKKKGRLPRVMLAAHMDEIGLMVKGISSKGKILFTVLGGVEPITLLGETVRLRAHNGHIHGIITTDEVTRGGVIENVPGLGDLFVDTGLGKNELEKLGVHIGTYLTLHKRSGSLGSHDIIAGKALDDRIGCYILIEVAKRLKSLRQEIFFVFTVQEEIGLYGAKTSAFTIDPDWGIAVDVSDSADLDDESTGSRIGKGPVITVMDGELIANRCINDWLQQIAKKNNIPCQLNISEFGTTDASKISISRGGVPSTVIGVAIRNIHTTTSIAHFKDIQHCITLLTLLLKNSPKVCIV